MDLDLPKYKIGDSLQNRAMKVIEAATTMKCRKFIKARDIVNENSRLNLAFLCHCFNMYPCLEKEVEFENRELGEVTGETREEKTFRNWINSLGVEPFVSDLQYELQDGWILLQVLEIVRKDPFSII